MTRARGILALGALALPCVVGSPVRAQEVAAVLSGASKSYQVALDSFMKDFAAPIAVFRLPEDKPSLGRKTRVVVAFGSEAAMKPYPESATLLACLAPGLPDNFSRDGRFASVAIKPSAEVLLTRLRDIQPGLKRLAVFWGSEATSDYVKELKRAAAALGMEIVDVRVRNPDGVPDALRTQRGNVQALWLAPDPGLVTPVVFQIMKQFSWDNAVPFYAPTAGLVASGATGSVSVDTEEAGREAARLARRALSGESVPGTVYPAKTALTVNRGSAAKAGLVLTPETLKRVDTVVP